MIKILKKLRKEKGLYLIVTELDAKAACITTDYEKEVTDYYFEIYLTEVSENIKNEFILERFKEFLINTIFEHYVDMIGVLNYVYNIRETIKMAKVHPSHSKFIFVTEFKNYKGDQSDSGDKPDTDEHNDEGSFFGLSFKTEFLDKKNLSFVEEVLLCSLMDLYEGNILVSKPKEVEIYLKEKETSKGVKEFININVRFFKSNK